LKKGDGHIVLPRELQAAIAKVVRDDRVSSVDGAGVSHVCSSS